jgi:hypothetical protein
MQAKKDEKAKLARRKEYEAQDELPLPLDLVPFREPNKNPTVLEKMQCTDEFYPKLVQQIREPKSHQDQGIGSSDVVFRLGDSKRRRTCQTT